MRVHVVGSLNHDVFLSVPALPRPGETLAGTGIEDAHGGKGMNQAVASACAGADTAMVGCVGGDAAGSELVDFARTRGVDVAGVGVVSGPTGTAHVLRADGGENCIVVTAGANAKVENAQVDAGLAGIAAGDLVVVQGEIPVAASERAVRVAEEAGARVVINLAPVVSFSGAALRRADPLVLNEVEAAWLLRVTPEEVAAAPEAAAARLLAHASSVVVTLGAAGAVVGTPGHSERIPAPATAQVVDTTGAGDAVVGVLAARLSRGQSIVDASRSAVAAATQSVTRRGASDSYSDAFREL
jgi:ribokinase